VFRITPVQKSVDWFLVTPFYDEVEVSEIDRIRPPSWWWSAGQRYGEWVGFTDTNWGRRNSL